MSFKHLFEPPRLWPVDPHGHRRATWMELFFDLIFVAAVAEAGTPLSTDYSAAGLLRYALLFLLIWWAWSGFTLYSTRFDSDDLTQRVLILAQCFIAAIMAANARDALDSRSSAGFGAAYAGMRVILVIQYLRARRVRETRGLATGYAVGFGIAAVLWIVSALFEPPQRYWLWTAALTVDFATPWFVVRQSLKTPPDAVHYPERFGLFTIILLGEFVASVMHGIESQEYWSFSAASTAFGSMAFAFVVRWWYFDVAQSASERHIRSRRSAAMFQIWHFAHLPLFLAIGVAGVGFRRIISLESGVTMNHAEAWILSGAAALLMLALAVIGATSEAAQKRGCISHYVWPQAVLAGLVAWLGMYGDQLHRSVFTAILLSVCVAQTLLTRREMEESPAVLARAS